MTKTKVAIVDDEILMIKGMKALLELEDDIIVTNEATNGKELLDIIEDDQLDADVILLDLSMPVLDGVDTLKELNKRKEDYKIIILTSHYNDSLILKMLDEGVSGFLAKNANPEEVANTIRKVMLKGFHINDHILQLIRQRRFSPNRKAVKESLSNREIEIIEQVCNEMSTKEIAEKLFISPRTVEGHRNRILDKTGCKNIAGVVVYAIEHNLFAVNISKFR